MSGIAEAAVSVIGEAALSALFEMLSKNIAEKFVTEKMVLSEIKKWGKILVEIREVLDDAEEKQMTKKPVKEWLMDVKDLAYDVEDILDEFATESQHRQLKTKHEAITSKVTQLIPTCCNNFSPRDFCFNSRMDSRIKNITARFEEITARRSFHELVKISGVASRRSRHHIQTTCVPDEPHIYGRDDDERRILDLLLRNDETNPAKYQVLPIVGMGGLGKTTLARQVFHHKSVEQNFGARAWVCVSDDFDVFRITKSILESISGKTCDQKELNQVQSQLQRELEAKRFLIVLDDVWSERHEDWHRLRPPFLVGAPGSRIIVTTREHPVADTMRTMDSYDLKCISDDACWELFARHAFEIIGIAAQPNDLKVIREKVKIKCDGLPLAARTLGGLLRSEPRDKWEEILDSRLWSLKGEDQGILPVLRLSYYNLPSDLKRCFSYCAIFPKDHEFTEMELVLLWMAEGLIQESGDGKQIEEVGSAYFHDLLSRSLFQVASKGSSKFVMHDLVNDLAKSINGDACFMLEDEAPGSKLKKERVRHCSYFPTETDGMKRFKPLYEMPHLRTLLPLSVIDFDYDYLTSDVLSNLLPKLRCLRVLSFKGYRIFEVPESIGKLKHLRYLDFSETELRCLPENVVSLCNLQTLLLRYCRNLKKLPLRMEKLINLRHLNIEGVELEGGLPLGVKELVSLRTLSNFSIGKNSGASLTALKNLNLLKGKLHISGLENQKDKNLQQLAREVNLKEKKGIRNLWLDWGYDHTEAKDKELLDGLQPSLELEVLYISGYRGTSFPNWLGNRLFHKLEVLNLIDCDECTSLPGLGLLPSLRKLSVVKMSKVRSVGSEFYGEGCSNPFPALQSLCFWNMYGWEDWNPCDFEFPCLNELTVCGCPKLLAKIPSRLSTLKKLHIDSCEELVVSLPNLPEILELRIKGCKEVDFRNMVEFGSPNNVELERILKFTLPITNRVIEEQLMNSKCLKVDEERGSLFSHVMPNLSSDLAEDKEKERRVAHGLEGLHVRNSKFFHSIWLHDMNLKPLRTLEFNNCGKFFCLKHVLLSSTFRRISISHCDAISISHCDALTSLPNVVGVGLVRLEIEGCKSLNSISRGQLSSSLGCLIIGNCDNLEILELDSGLVNLKLLQVFNCHSLASLSLPPSLKLESLIVAKCNSLTSLSLPPTFLPNSLFVSQCNSLKSLCWV